MAKKIKEANKKVNPILWFLFAVVIPITIVITLIIIILNIAGIDALGYMKEKGNEVPALSNMITTDEEKDQSMEQMEKEYKETIVSKDKEIEELNITIENLEGKVNQLEKEIIQFESEKIEQQSTKENAEIEVENQSLKATSKTYEEMDTEQAAIIIETLELDSALSILQLLSSDVQASILGQMNPETAAEFTQKMITNE